MIKAAVTALKKIDKLPEDPKELPKAIKDILIDSGRVDQYYNEIFKRVVNMRKLLDEDRTNEVSQRDIELTREYVRRFVRDLGPIIEEKPHAVHGMSLPGIPAEENEEKHEKKPKKAKKHGRAKLINHSKKKKK
jgi:DNA-binding ferritin-like protein (Dps family)